jgi:hypothetical protein
MPTIAASWLATDDGHWLAYLRMILIISFEDCRRQSLHGAVLRAVDKG